MPIERCRCGNKATSACNDCQRALCDDCSSPDYRCDQCVGLNYEVASLFDDPETASLDDDDEDWHGIDANIDVSDWGEDLDAQEDY